jgi:hypothetical protein
MCMKYKSWVGEGCKNAGREYIYEVQIKLTNTSVRSILPVFHPHVTGALDSWTRSSGDFTLWAPWNESNLEW